MQYISPNLTPDDAASVLFYQDSDGYNVDKNIKIDEKLIVGARSCLGAGYQLNPIRGRNAGKSYWTFLRYSASKTDALPVQIRSLVDAVRRKGEQSLYTSDGVKTQFNTVVPNTSGIADTAYAPSNTLLNPEYLYTFYAPNLTFNGSTDSRFEVFYSYKDSGGIISTPKVMPSGSSRMLISNASMSPATFIQFPVRTYVLQVHFYITNYSGDGLVYTTTSLSNEFVNMQKALGFFENGLVVLYKRDKDYTIASDIIPGTRPKVDFSLLEKWETKFLL